MVYGVPDSTTTLSCIIHVHKQHSKICIWRTKSRVTWTCKRRANGPNPHEHNGPNRRNSAIDSNWRVLSNMGSHYVVCPTLGARLSNPTQSNVVQQIIPRKRKRSHYGSHREPRQTKTISDLPNELIDEILAHVLDQFYNEAVGIFEILELRHVSRSWNKYIRSRYYRRLNLNFSIDSNRRSRHFVTPTGDIARILNTLLNDDELRSQVTHVSINAWLLLDQYPVSIPNMSTITSSYPFMRALSDICTTTTPHIRPPVYSVGTQRRRPPQTIQTSTEEWRAAITYGRPDAVCALILSLLPNLTSLAIEHWPTECNIYETFSSTRHPSSSLNSTQMPGTTTTATATNPKNIPTDNVVPNFLLHLFQITTARYHAHNSQPGRPHSNSFSNTDDSMIMTYHVNPPLVLQNLKSIGISTHYNRAAPSPAASYMPLLLIPWLKAATLHGDWNNSTRRRMDQTTITELVILNPGNSFSTPALRSLILASPQLRSIVVLYRDNVLDPKPPTPELTVGNIVKSVPQRADPAQSSRISTSPRAPPIDHLYVSSNHFTMPDIRHFSDIRTVTVEGFTTTPDSLRIITSCTLPTSVARINIVLPPDHITVGYTGQIDPAFRRLRYLLWIIIEQFNTPILSSALPNIRRITIAAPANEITTINNNSSTSSVMHRATEMLSELGIKLTLTELPWNLQTAQGMRHTPSPAGRISTYHSFFGDCTDT